MLLLPWTQRISHQSRPQRDRRSSEARFCPADERACCRVIEFSDTAPTLLLRPRFCNRNRSATRSAPAEPRSATASGQTGVHADAPRQAAATNRPRGPEVFSDSSGRPDHPRSCVPSPPRGGNSICRVRPNFGSTVARFCSPLRKKPHLKNGPGQFLDSFSLPLPFQIIAGCRPEKASGCPPVGEITLMAKDIRASTCFPGRGRCES